jgi:Uma2 family endonuclease
MTTAILIEDQVEIPAIADLDDFRRWATSEAFPDSGRIAYVAGRIEVDMSPEDLHTHGTVKVELVGSLWQRIKSVELGELYSDRTRVSCPQADLSDEPDIVFVSEEAFDSGRVRLVPKASGEEDRYVELEGSPDLIVEIVSDSSVRKDTKRLPKTYWRAGVREFWLIDARRERLSFRLQHHGESGYEPAPTDADGYQYSAVLDAWYKLQRTRNRRGCWQYTLQTK